MMHSYTYPSKNLFDEHRFVFRSKADLENDLNEYEKNDAGSSPDSNDSAILDSKRKQEAAEKLDNIHTTFKQRILSYWNPTIAEEQALNSLSKDFAAQAKIDLMNSNNAALQKLGRAFNKKDNKCELNQERRDIIRERIEVLDARTNALNERLDRLQKVRTLSRKNARFFAQKKEEWQQQKSVLLDILNKLDRDDTERDLAEKMKDIESLDHDIRTHIISMVDLNHPDVIRDVLPHIDEALIANAAGDAGPFKILITAIANLGRRKIIRIEPGALRIMEEMAAAMRPDKKNAYGYAARRFYANLGRRRMDAVNLSDTDKSLTELKKMPIGQRVQIGGKPFVVTSKREKSIIVRQTEAGGRTAAIDTEGEENKAKTSKEFTILLRDPSKKKKDEERKLQVKPKSSSAAMSDQTFHFDLV